MGNQADTKEYEDQKVSVENGGEAMPLEVQKAGDQWMLQQGAQFLRLGHIRNGSNVEIILTIRQIQTVHYDLVLLHFLIV